MVYNIRKPGFWAVLDTANLEYTSSDVLYEKGARFIKISREDASGVLELARKTGYEIERVK
jgi:hypothetical protein